MTPGCMIERIPEGAVGEAAVVHDTPCASARLHGAMHGQPLSADKYTRLLIGGSVVMTDAEFECRTNGEFVRAARGDVLVAGLGIGLVLYRLLSDDRVKSITVLEKCADVIALVAPHLFDGDRLIVLLADVFDWKPPRKRFDCIYFDIWANIPNGDDADDIRVLKKRYRPALRRGGWMKAWCENNAR